MEAGRWRRKGAGGGIKISEGRKGAVGNRCRQIGANASRWGQQMGPMQAGNSVKFSERRRSLEGLRE